MKTGVQYYRPPFPETRFWADDMARIRDTGLDMIQLWVIWGWVEPRPGAMQFDDYDRLVDLAAENGLGVVLSTVAEIHPFWIHRVVPEAELVDHLNRPVVSCPRAEVNVGLSPGGCFDHPEIAARMAGFLTQLGARYGGRPHVVGWDCWNETRWNVHADGLTCYCRHTLADFRAWLQDRYGSLEALGDAWKRRYDSWDDVRPSKKTAGPFSEMLDWGRYHSWRSANHARWRAEAIRAGGAAQPITAHGPMPTICCPPVTAEVPLCRGNDWELADVLDGVGSSHFPVSQGLTPATLGCRLQEVISAAKPGKLAWVSELQGSSSTLGYGRGGGARGPASAQKLWVFDALSRGYDAMIFWQWRDERFCRESGTGGLAGADGLASPRLAALREAMQWKREQAELITGYVPDRARVGVLFPPEGFLLNWAYAGHVDDARWTLMGYGAALEQLGIPYEFVEANHLDRLDELTVLLMPWCQRVPEAATARIADWVRRGGTLLIEAETDAFTAGGFYRELDERPLLQALGLRELGRRPLPPDHRLALQWDGKRIELPVQHFATAFEATSAAEVLGTSDDGEAFILRQPAGQGLVGALGGFAGRAYYEAEGTGLEDLLRQVCGDAASFDVRIDSDPPGASGLFRRLGRSGDRRVLWLMNYGDAERTVTVRASVETGRAAQPAELVRGVVTVAHDGPGLTMTLSIPACDAAVLTWQADPNRS